MKPAAAYIRVSTEEQTELSPDSQIKAIREYAAHHNYHVPDQFIFADEGISGKNTKKRAAFHRMIAAAGTKPKPFEAVLVWKFSRFARSRQDSILYKSILRKQLRIAVISVTEPVSDDPVSLLMEAMIEAMDEYYSVNLAQEVRRGMEEKVRRGNPVFCPPLGYRTENGRWVIEESQATVVQEIYRLFLLHGDAAIVTDLINQSGYRTARGNLFDRRSIRYILQNPAYIGMLRWNRRGITGRKFTNENLMILPGTHRPIIAQETWQAAQALLQCRK